jgi:hypothetical protein
MGHRKVFNVFLEWWWATGTFLLHSVGIEVIQAQQSLESRYWRLLSLLTTNVVSHTEGVRWSVVLIYHDGTPKSRMSRAI